MRHRIVLCATGIDRTDQNSQNFNGAVLDCDLASSATSQLIESVKMLPRRG